MLYSEDNVLKWKYSQPALKSTESAVQHEVSADLPFTCHLAASWRKKCGRLLADSHLLLLWAWHWVADLQAAEAGPVDRQSQQNNTIQEYKAKT